VTVGIISRKYFPVLFNENQVDNMFDHF